MRLGVGHLLPPLLLLKSGCEVENEILIAKGL